VFEEADGLGLDELVDHVAEDGADGKEALVGVTDVGEPGLVEEDLLHDEDRDSLGEFRAGLHDAQAERDDLRREEEVDHRVVVVLLGGRVRVRKGWGRVGGCKGGASTHLDESADDAEGGEAQILEWARFGSRIQEGIQEERYMCYYFVASIAAHSGGEEQQVRTIQEELSCLGMRCDTLKQSEGIANAVRYVRCQVGRGEHWIDGHDLLEESWHDT
jgi:hypothetical protein